MGLLSWIIVGLIAGWLAGKIIKGRGYGLLADIALGITGALLGGYLASYFFEVENAVSGINLPAIITSFIGALIIAGLVHLLAGRHH